MENEFLERLKARINEDRSNQKVSDWICSNTTLKGNPFSFKNHEFQIDIANDMHQNVCVKKLSQVGLSEISYRKMLCFLSKNRGSTGLYTFPDIVMKKNQAQTRIKPIFDRDFPKNQDSSEVRNNDVMQLGDSFLYISANTESAATSTSVDFIMNDEYDLSDQMFLALVNSRIQHSSFKLKHGFSTPTFTGYGISLEYDSSDQREYWCKCGHCGHWQIPLYDTKSVFIPGLPDSVSDLRTDIDENMAVGLDLDNAYVRCLKCGKKLDLNNPENREWVARYPSRINTHGYWVRPFSSNLLSIKYLVMTMADFIKKNQLRRGVNTVLGEDYSDSSTRLEKESIMRCMKSREVPEISKEKPVYIGIDMGLSCHIALSCNETDVVYTTVVPAEDIIDTVKVLLDKYNIVCGAIDRYPYTPTSNAIRDMSEGRIMPVEYSAGKQAEEVKETDGSVSHYRINRTDALDFIMQEVNSGKLNIYGYGNYQNVILEQLRDMFRDDSDKDKQPKWVKITGNDHFFHAISYSFAARKIKYVQEFSGEEPESRYCLSIASSTQSKKDVYNSDLLSYSSSPDRKIIRRW